MTNGENQERILPFKLLALAHIEVLLSLIHTLAKRHITALPSLLKGETYG